MGKLSRKDAKVLSLLATTPELKDKLNEYIDAEKVANKLWKKFREAVVNGEEVKTVESTEVKRKFKVGDKVRVNSIAGDVATTRCITGDITEVVSYKHDDPEQWVNFLERPVITERGYFEESALELVEEKSPNQLRAEVIEKAKKYVEKWLEPNTHKGCGAIKYDIYAIVPHLTANKEKRVVHFVGKGVYTKKLRARGIAKCHPDDVFNEHIGKAIALGRALGKDVNEFENAPQPNKIVAGMKIKRETDGSVFNAVHLCPCNGSYTILDDTNAKY